MEVRPTDFFDMTEAIVRRDDLQDLFSQTVFVDDIVLLLTEETHEVLIAIGPFGYRVAKVRTGGLMLFEVGIFTDCTVFVDDVMHSRENPPRWARAFRS